MLTEILAGKGAQKVYGVESSLEILESLRKNSRHADNVEFIPGETSRIPLPDSSVDLIVCISVLEHVMDIDSILKEWHRILRVKGEVLIAWSGWGHPDASHLGSLIPIPYSQCIFSERTLARTAARIRRLSLHSQSFWQTDTTAEPQNDPCSDQYCSGFLNKMTIGQFNRKLRKDSSFDVTQHTCHPPSWLPQIRQLFFMPFFREHLTSFSTYILTKPDN